MTDNTLMAHLRAQDRGATAICHRDLALSFGRLLDDVERIAAHLQLAGVAPGRIVAVDVRTPVSYWVVTLALLRLGAVSVGLTNNFADECAALPDIDAVVTGAGEAARHPHARRIEIARDWLDGPVPRDSDLPDAATADAALGRVIFTSGTSGTPKAFLLDAERLKNRLDGTAGRSLICADTRLWCGLGPDTAYGFTATLAAWMAGGCVIFGGGARGLLGRLGDHKVNLILASPAALQSLARDVPGRMTLAADAIIAGGRLSVALRDRLRPVIAGDLYVAYGSSEAGGVTRGSADLLDRHPGCAGVPFDDVDVEIVDEYGQKLPAGTPGLIRTRSASLAQGYLNDDAGSAALFEAGWFQSGDHGKLESDGMLVVLGRPANTLNVGGVKVSAEEVEAAARALDGVLDACAVDLGASGLAVALAADTVQPDDAGKALRAAMPRLPRFHLIPVPEIPRNSMGKINRDTYAAALERELEAPDAVGGIRREGPF